jgi:digeranylgeranylglycerophospholipid reductase
MTRVTRKTCDVLVVGAGPGGSSAARAAAEAGADVLVVDRRDEIGVPVQCAELAPAPLLLDVPVSRGVVVQRTTGIDTHLPSGETVETEAPGVMLDRALFDRELADAAREAGARIETGTSLVDWVGDAAVLRRSDAEEIVMARVVIGADGPRSAVGEHVGRENVSFAAAKQVEVLLEAEITRTHIFFDPLFRGGYGWLFPKGEIGNLGVGVEAGRSDVLNEAVELLMARTAGLGLTMGTSVLGRSGGLIPVGGPLGTARVGSVLLVGDAAGQTHPVTGAGIHAATSCGQMAGRAAARYARSGDEKDLARYEKAWRFLWSDELRLATKRRAELLERWDDSLEEAVRSCWVVFPAYYERR